MKTQHIKFEILNERLTLLKCNLIQLNFVLSMLVIGRICNAKDKAREAGLAAL